MWEDLDLYGGGGDILDDLLGTWDLGQMDSP
jgi:hypothetical protein